MFWFVFFFFFKQKTAYEMRISDWSSDVCSSDLIADQLAITFHGAHWCRCVGEAALDQHGKHVDCKGMPELMGAKPDRDAGVRAAAARPCEDRFPRVGQHRMAHLGQPEDRSEEHTSELQSLMRISYADFCLQKKQLKTTQQ